MLKTPTFPIFGPPIETRSQASENPIKSVWDELLVFSSPYFIKKFWKAVNPSDESINFIATSITQAYEYFQASLQCGIHTKPLLLYYSVLNLTRAVLAVKNVSIENLSLHGLSFNKRKESNEFFDIEILLCKKGIVPRLAEVLSTEWYAEENKNFNLLDQFLGIIEFIDTMGNVFEISPTIIPIELRRHTDGSIYWTIEVYNPEHANEIKEKINKKTSLMADFEERQNNGRIEFHCTKVVSPRGKLDKASNEFFRSHFEFGLFNAQDRIVYVDIAPVNVPQECRYYIISYVLGMLVRYYPQKLHRFLYNEELKYRRLIEKSCDLVSRIYPNLMLNLLTGVHNKFVTGM